MKNLWKHIAFYLPKKALTKYLLLGLMAVFTEDVLLHVKSPLIVPKLVEKEKCEKEKEISDEDAYDQSTTSTGKLRKIRIPFDTILVWAFEASVQPSQVWHTTFLPTRLPVVQNDFFAHTPRYLYFHSLLM